MKFFCFLLTTVLSWRRNSFFPCLCAAGCSQIKTFFWPLDFSFLMLPASQFSFSPARSHGCFCEPPGLVLPFRQLILLVTLLRLVLHPIFYDDLLPTCFSISSPNATTKWPSFPFFRRRHCLSLLYHIVTTPPVLYGVVPAHNDCSSPLV